ncbi:MAG TPA: hypothetical protein VHG93_02735, partial [Longimicrobium sp.]|nr:hypothetical protein [Longimicrobium sp.]
AAPRAGDARPDEAEMTSVAGQVPELGGYYFDAAGELVVSLTDPARAEAARTALAGVAQRGNGRTRVRAARYTFLQLRGWRDAWSGALLEVPGVSFVDLDEAANQVVVGIADPAARARVLDLLRPAGVPVPAIGFEAAGSVRRHELVEYAPYLYAAPAQGDSVTSYRRPLEGGLKLTYRKSSDPNMAVTCTLGFVARLNGLRVVVTASHCSMRHWDGDNTIYYQSVPGADRYFGYEYRDPNGSSCGFMSINVCRNADASAAYVDAGAADNPGYIARPLGPPPEGRNPYVTIAGSRVIDAANPRFRVTGRGAPEVNQPVDKVGATTGWTRGRVARTCVDVNADRSNSKLRCQTFASYSSGQGDSGAPVFMAFADGTATLMGVHWGATEDGAYSVYSSMARVEMDLGSLSIVAGSGSTPPPDGGGGSPPGEGGGGPPGGCGVECIS